MENKKIVLLTFDEDQVRMPYKIRDFDNKIAKKLQNIVIVYLS